MKFYTENKIYQPNFMKDDKLFSINNYLCQEFKDQVLREETKSKILILSSKKIIIFCTRKKILIDS